MENPAVGGQKSGGAETVETKNETNETNSEIIETNSVESGKS